jgi:hypothetical protein
VRSKEARVKTGTGNPFGDQTSILTGRQTTIRSPATSKQEAAWLLPRRTHVIIKNLSCLLGDFKSDGVPGFLLPDGRTVDSITARSDVLDSNANDVTATQFAVDGKIEQSEVALTPLDLQLRSDRPDML